MAKTHHVVYNKTEKEWQVKAGGAQKASNNFDTKVEAVNKARVISRNQKTELKIHDKNGVIRESDSHGKDSYPPKG